ncbi:RTT107-like protein [Fusarium heterosporum]|uniref:RTT107-like protein n=1 Tax=Fusarium heterosporum TaxID=42747 RepID=A0A8H5SVF5_FUSHE|nr:RTT107-like protein [Fusarium heterosporum]
MSTFQKRFLAAIIKSLLRGKSLVQSLIAYWSSSMGHEVNSNTRAGNTSRKTIQEFLKEAEALFLDPVSQDELRQLSSNIRKQLLQRLETDMECMLPSYSHQLPRGTEVGRFVALDVGGSTLRVALVELCGRVSNVGEESRIVSIKNYYITPEIKALEGMAFFDWMAERILETLSAELDGHDASDGPLPMSLAWSFPIEQTSLGGGKLQGMGKGFCACNGLLGQDLGEIVRTACQGRGLNVELRAVVNDSSACLLSESYNHPTTRFGLILGTGVNLAAYLPVSAIGRVKFGERPPQWFEKATHVIINSEISMMGRDILPLTRWDRQLLANHSRPDFQPLEHMVSGMYLGEICRLALVEAIETTGIFGGAVPASLQKPYSFSTATLSLIEVDTSSDLKEAREQFSSRHPANHTPTTADMAFLKQLASYVSKRSSALVATGVHAFWNLRIDSQNKYVSTLSPESSERRSAEADRDLAETTVAYNGGVIESYPGYLDSCQSYLNDLVASDKQEKVGTRTIKLVSAKESSLMGAAVALASLEEVVKGPLGVLSTILSENGAHICEPRRDGSLPIEKVTHIVSNTIDFPQFTESQAVMIPVVTTQWILTSMARRKQAQIRPFSPDPRMIFSEVVVACADLPETDKESIAGATMALGGQESKDVNRMTTHICALSMEHPKIQNSIQKGWKGKVVLPHWFDDCFKLGKRIDERPYLLPNPEILKKAPEDELKIPVNQNLEGATSPAPTNLALPSDGDVVRPPAVVFQDHNVMLCGDLSITDRLAKVVKEIIINGGGKMVDTVEDCDMFICQYRDGPEYIQASQACKQVGNLAWLYWLIVHNEWASPLRRLLHYPIPKKPIEGFEGLRITVSNYGGEARIYLENLIKASGAEFTKTMKSENTHLITARDTSEKCKAAPEWGIAVLNHLWIEESYAKCRMQPVNTKKYNHFPPRTNLGEIIGQTFFDESKLRESYYPGGEKELSPQAKRKRKVLEIAGENAYPRGPAEGVVVGKVGSEDTEMSDLPESENKKVAKKGAKTTGGVATPIRPRHAGKENDTPSVVSTGGRSAKAKAQAILHGLTDDIALYEKEKKRHAKGGTAIWGGKRAADQAEKTSTKTKPSAEPEEAEDEDSTTKRPAKKAKPTLPGIEMRIILTGFPRWVGDKNKEDQDRKKLRDLGIQIVQENQPCDYLAAPAIVRTVKFLTALARGATVIDSTFIDETLNTGSVPDVEDFILKDKEAEKRYDVDLSRSVARAKANKCKLLAGVPIYCTEKIRNGADSYKAVAEANGAIFKLYRARSGTTIRPTTAEEEGNAPPEPVYLLSSAGAEEKPLWNRFREMARKGNMEPRIVAPDWLLDVAMVQQVRFDKKFLAEEYYS